MVKSSREKDHSLWVAQLELTISANPDVLVTNNVLK
jgi:hypothetical protein